MISVFKIDGQNQTLPIVGWSKIDFFQYRMIENV
jgi:hypothetical protein